MNYTNNDAGELTARGTYVPTGVDTYELPGSFMTIRFDTNAFYWILEDNEAGVTSLYYAPGNAGTFPLTGWEVANGDPPAPTWTAESGGGSSSGGAAGVMMALLNG